MANSTDSGRYSLEITLYDQQLADSLLEQLAEEPNLEVTSAPEAGILPILPIVVAGLATFAGVATVVEWIRKNHQCQQVLDARKDPISIVENCNIRDGRIIVIAKDGDAVEIVDVPPVIDLTDIIKSSVTATIDAVKKAAEAAGAKTNPVSPDAA